MLIFHVETNPRFILVPITGLCNIPVSNVTAWMSPMETQVNCKSVAWLACYI